MLLTVLQHFTVEYPYFYMYFSISIGSLKFLHLSPALFWGPIDTAALGAVKRGFCTPGAAYDLQSICVSFMQFKIPEMRRNELHNLD